ncbi:hypothetical protein CALCODRAFT_511489 [Calocera cornea HHB12733]|uniref:RING-type domain-containing protein n=1 Tax=Calocera cornea HHB12733 TaxID=1353952 RepID=A0A165DR05_9BASI|nr:hypothetical protein CALCODRAFT_511489 [Calocera cornea HHB12733]
MSGPTPTPTGAIHVDNNNMEEDIKIIEHWQASIECTDIEIVFMGWCRHAETLATHQQVVRHLSRRVPLTTAIEDSLAIVLVLYPDANVEDIAQLLCTFLPLFEECGVKETLKCLSNPRQYHKYLLWDQSVTSCRGTTEPQAGDDLNNQAIDDSPEDEELQECECCFALVHRMRMVVCIHGHSLCGPCMERQVLNLVSGQKTAVRCIAMATNSCTYTFPLHVVKPFLSPPVKRVLNQYMQVKELKNVDGIIFCNFCNYVCQVDSSYSATLLLCGHNRTGASHGGRQTGITTGMGNGEQIWMMPAHPVSKLTGEHLPLAEGGAMCSGRWRTGSGFHLIAAPWVKVRQHPPRDNEPPVKVDMADASIPMEADSARTECCWFLRYL